MDVNLVYSQHWSKADLVQLLISQSIELRNESVIDRLTLEDLCEAVSSILFDLLVVLFNVILF